MVEIIEAAKSEDGRDLLDSTSEPAYFTIDVTPTLDVAQTGAGTAAITVNGSAREYTVVYAAEVTYEEGSTTPKQPAEGDYVTATVRGNGTLTVKGLEEGTTLCVQAALVEEGEAVSKVAMAFLPVISWDWAAKPTVTAAQNLDKDGKLDIVFTDNASEIYTGEDKSDLVAYRIVAGGKTIVAYVEPFQDHYTLVTYDGTQTTVIGQNDKTAGTWTATVDYEKGTAKKDTITVTPMVMDSEDKTETVYTGATGSVTYNCSGFMPAAWKTAPRISQKVERNTVDFSMHLYGGATTAMVKIDGKVYALSALEEAFPGEITVTHNEDADDEWDIMVTYGGKKLGYGTHRFAFAGVDPAADSDAVGAYTGESKVTITATPAWASKKIALKIAQKDDTTVTLSFTNLGQYDDNGSLQDYYVACKGNVDEYNNLIWEKIPLDRATLDAKGKTWTIEADLDSMEILTYDQPTTFYIKATGPNYDTSLAPFTTKVTEASVTLKKLWQTKPSVKVTYSTAEREATMVVTGKGNPDGFELEWSATGKAPWYPISFTDGVATIEGDYQTTITATPDANNDAVWTYVLSTDANYSGKLYIMVTPCKYSTTSEAFENSYGVSATTTVKIAPAWTTKAPKVTLKQIDETTVTATWSAIAVANHYDVTVTGPDAEDAEVSTVYNEKKKTYTATITGLTEGQKYDIYVTPYYQEYAKDAEEGDEPVVDEKGTFGKATITLTRLWQKTPVVKITYDKKTDGMTVKGTVTYYGCPEHLEVSIAGNGLKTEPIDLTKYDDFGDAGTTGNTLGFSFIVAAVGEREAEGYYYEYAPGTYTVTATAYDDNKETVVSSRTVKATVNEAFLGDKIKVKSITQLTECSGKITISALNIKTANNARFRVYIVDE